MYVTKKLVCDLQQNDYIFMVNDTYHTGNRIRRFGGIYAYCRYFIDPEVVDISVNTIQKNMSYA